jgi:NADH-quinone oxidoreductase subunit G
MATIYIENKPYKVQDEQNLLHACLGLGFDIPYFCWHPALGSIGSCRVCAVKQYKDENDSSGSIVMSCTTPARDGTRISIEDPEVVAFRASMLELLMINHPHDCPVCDEGGECHLQDMTVMTGHCSRRHRFTKRTFPNQDLGPFIHHEMNRCIQCYRCVRFYHDHADGTDLQALGSRNNVYYGRLGDGKLKSNFSGNLVEVCPTGVFTDKPAKDQPVRKWDLQTAPGICGLCSLGCNTIPAERGGILRRVMNRYHSAVNGYFLCDRGRYGHGYVNSEHRVRSLRLPTGAIDPNKDAGHGLQKLLAKANGIVGIGSPRASLESNFAIRSVVGEEHFSNGLAKEESQTVSALLNVLENCGSRVVSLAEVAGADCILVLGEDISNTAPMLELAVRQAVHRYQMRVAPSKGIASWDAGSTKLVQTNESMPLSLLAPAGMEISDLARRRLARAPSDIARIGFAIAHYLQSGAPGVSDLSAEDDTFAREVAAEMAQAKRPLVISGTGLLTEALVESAGNISTALAASHDQSGIYLVAAEANSLGVGLMSGRSVEEVLNSVILGQADTVIILENDLYHRVSRETLAKLRKSASMIIVLDHLYNETTHLADWVLPVGTMAEISGSYVSSEGRLQRYYNVMPPKGDIRAAWDWFSGDKTSSLDRITQQIAVAIPGLSGMTDLAPASDFRMGQRKIPRMSHRASGRGSITADKEVSEGQIPLDDETPLTYSMEGTSEQPPAALVSRYWAPGWNSVQALNRFQEEISGVMSGGDAGIRIFEDRKVGDRSYFNTIPTPFPALEVELEAVPLYRIFGSEELSMTAKAVCETAEIGLLMISPADAGRMNLASGDSVTIILASAIEEPAPQLTMQLKVSSEVATGVCGYYRPYESYEGKESRSTTAAVLTELAARRVKLEKASGGGQS